MKLFPIPYIKILKLVAILSIFSLVSAYVAEHIFGFKPCKLCLYQRIPYFLLIIVSASAWILKDNSILKLLNYICGGIFFVGFVLSSYHVMVEHGIIMEPCHITDTASDLNMLRNLILHHTISCKDVPFRILGLSMAEINTVVSLLLTIGIFYNTRATLKK